MRQLNGIYSQRVNRRHSLAGHVFQGRYPAVLVQKEAHLLELARYIVLNPVRAGMVRPPTSGTGAATIACLTVLESQSGSTQNGCSTKLASVKLTPLTPIDNSLSQGRGRRAR